ncbi:MAG: PorT family protein [Chlorobi bacterium]|nr:PorT family protein [Chlorobiota bacterium]
MKQAFIIFISTVFLSTVNSLFAQNNNYQKLKFGIVAEPQLTWLSSDIINVENSGIKAGIKYGLNMEKYFQENYAFSTGLLINNTGGALRYNDTIFFQISNTIDTLFSGDEVKYNIQYIEIPLALKFTTNQIGYIKYFAQIGLNGQIKIKATGNILNSNYQKAKINDEVSLFNAGYHIGGGIQYSLGGNASLIAALTFTNGFIDITPTQKGDENDPGKPVRLEDRIIMNSLAVKIGIIF